MRIQVEGKTVYELNDTKKKVIQNDIQEELFEKDMERRVKHIIEHKYEQCMERLRKEWTPKLSQRFTTLPTNNDALAELIFGQEDYKSRSQREADDIKEEKLRRTGQM